MIRRLAAARIGSTFNQYAASAHLRERLADYLERRSEAELLLVGEAAGYRGARVSGIPFTSERQLTGSGPAEASATIVHRVLDELGLDGARAALERRPDAPAPAGRAAVQPPPAGRRDRGVASVPRATSPRAAVVPVGRVAEAALGTAGIRHPSHGGAQEFRAGLAALV